MSQRAHTRRSIPPAVYWALVTVLVLFGLLAIFSIGAPFLLLGLTLAVVAPWRRRPTVLWPAVSTVLGFVAGLLLAFPWSCEQSIGPGPAVTNGTHGSCSTALGLFNYPTANPTLLPALISGLVTAAIAGAITHRLLKRRLEKTAASIRV